MKTKNSITFFVAAMIVTIIAAYIGSYFVLSRMGPEENFFGRRCWVFDDGNSDKERFLTKIYWPLLLLDSKLLGNPHSEICVREMESYAREMKRTFTQR